jgi:hypothetical protein
LVRQQVLQALDPVLLHFYVVFVVDRLVYVRLHYVVVVLGHCHGDVLIPLEFLVGVVLLAELLDLITECVLFKPVLQLDLVLPNQFLKPCLLLDHEVLVENGFLIPARLEIFLGLLDGQELSFNVVRT